LNTWPGKKKRKMGNLDFKIQRANSLLNLATNIERLEKDYWRDEKNGEVSTLHVILAGPHNKIDVRGTVIDIIEEALLLAEEVGLEIFEAQQKRKEKNVES
jgi:hypothetical protein